ncbi:ubiquinone/menaquinone biosynthesis C-methylase UbiE [Thermosporothrix hazakensis]|jgi:ubiquinone/menaquinone biosynthesis C-methylase UbiE|uniref:Ubiquinone/menaquinone biosynthesis C-methylase UbiE n=2 Tax=Thermosporothrix TaxID=768650 RepID=A0A326U196_THEHA|nr:class I SAM-dependent methyltransferase [Thermosporothrix hazakensis]PZW23405.1 ubiquinone/menaquinone biosynthesis C-methylase UbiE [Thermosporothrix hazakensis]BBH89750.1 methyltransferase [Thermosporothrix sp. COM3]GCE47939.1 methyltransferase [Thermosporothrix hazakensis]
MPIDFHATRNHRSYADRQADSTWRDFMRALITIEGKDIADIGCGGGIYTAAFADMGAAHVTGVDFSETMLQDAREQCSGYDTVSFQQGDALHTGLADAHFDVILERGLTHHLKQEQLPACFAEAYRLLRPGGVLFVQNRTPEDCQLPGSDTNPRGYFFEKFPRLLTIETSRRPNSVTTMAALQQAGFTRIEERHLWEIKEVYPNIEKLTEHILTRKGRSILHELTDTELQELAEYIRERYSDQQGEIVEQCRWTVWCAWKA